MIARLFRRKSAMQAEGGSALSSLAVTFSYGNSARYGVPVLPIETLASLDEEVRLHSRAANLPHALENESLLGDIVSVRQTERGAFISGARAGLAIRWLAPDCLHVVLKHKDLPPVYSAERTGMLEEQNSPISLEWGESNDAVGMASGVVECVISKRAGTLMLRMNDGSAAFDEVQPPIWYGRGWRQVVRIALDTGVHGFGARLQSQDLRGQRLDVYPDSARGVVAPVPFLLMVSPRASCGVYWPTTARLVVDAGSTQPERALVDVQDAQPEYFLIVSPSPMGVLARLASLFPVLALPPLWALGAHFAGKALDTEQRTREFASDVQERGIPCAALQLGASLMEGGRPLTINAGRFPNFSELVDELHVRGAQVIVEAHPAIQLDESYPLYTSGLRRRVFMTYPDGNPYRAAAASGTSLFPDFVREDVRVWWSEQMRPLVRTGIDGVALYRANPDISRRDDTEALPDVVQHKLGSETVRHSALRSRYSGRMAEACRSAIVRDRSALRPFVRQSSGSLDLAQYGSLTIEAGSTWEGLRAAVRAALNGCASGIQLVGLEIEAFEGELLARALQAACLLPGLVCSLGREQAVYPWSFGDEIEAVCRETLRLRRRILPYLYTSIALAREYGVPVVRPTWMLDPTNMPASRSDDTYLVGDHVLVAPVLAVGQRERSLYVPPGLWYDFASHQSLEGGRVHQLQVPLNRVPLFVRAGAVLNLAPDEGAQGSTIRVYPGVNDTTTYDDPGEGFSHLNGDYRWVYYTCGWETNQCFVMSRRRTGGYFPSDRHLRIEVVGLGETPEEVRIDRHGAPLWYYDQGILEVAADDEAARMEVWLSGSPTSPTRKRRAL